MLDISSVVEEQCGLAMAKKEDISGLSLTPGTFTIYHST